MKIVHWDEFVWDDKNTYWGNPSYQLEPGDPGYIPPTPPSPPPKKRSKKTKNMASNPTPDRYDELVSAGEDLCDGLTQHAVAIGIKQNTFTDTRADLDALIAAHNAQKAAEGAQPAAFNALRLADSNAKGFIATAVKVLSVTLGNQWSDAWEATGLPDNRVGVPTTQDGRYAALNSLKAYLTANPGKEIDTDTVKVTAAIANTLWLAVKAGRTGTGNVLKNTKDAVLDKQEKQAAFRERYRGTIDELEQKLDDEDPRFYDFGLNRPADPATPGVPLTVLATPIGGGKVLVQIDGARRANSFNYYKQITPADPEPVQVLNTENTQQTLEGLTPGATVQITVTGVNKAGEGPASAPVSVVVT